MTKEKAKKGFIIRVLDTVGHVGNNLPNPATIFLILTGIMIVLSAICAALGISVTYDFLDSVSSEISQETVQVVDFLAPDSIRHIVTIVVSNFIRLFALGTVFTIMIGVGVADGTGFMSASPHKVVASTPKAFVTAAVVLLGIASNIASSIDYVALVPLEVILFIAFGRHPIAGLVTVFVGVFGGQSASLLAGTSDLTLVGISTQAVQMIDLGYTILPICNWYFVIASTSLITIVGATVTDKLIEPRLAPYMPDASEVAQDIAENEKCDMCWAGITALAYAIFIAVLIVPFSGFLRNFETHVFLTSPFISGIIFFMMLLSLLPDLAYGIGAGTARNDKDVVALMNKTITRLTGFMVLIFFAAQFTSYFNYSNLRTTVSVSGVSFLQSVGFVGLPLIICLIVLTALINIFITVDSTKRAIMAPVFVPMFMRLGLSLELIQATYRIGDSSTNIIAPLMPFFVLTVAFLQKYDRKAGIGSVISIMLPYFLTFLTGWIIMFVVWYPLGPPLGSGSSMSYQLNYVQRCTAYHAVMSYTRNASGGRQPIHGSIPHIIDSHTGDPE